MYDVTLILHKRGEPLQFENVIEITQDGNFVHVTKENLNVLFRIGAIEHIIVNIHIVKM